MSQKYHMFGSRSEEESGNQGSMLLSLEDPDELYLQRWLQHQGLGGFQAAPPALAALLGGQVFGGRG